MGSDRPLGVTIIGWCSVVLSGVCLPGSLLVLVTPHAAGVIDSDLQCAALPIDNIWLFIAAVFLLKRKAWARAALILWLPFHFFAMPAVFHEPLPSAGLAWGIAKAVLSALIIIMYLLTRRVSEWFKPGRSNTDGSTGGPAAEP